MARRRSRIVQVGNGITIRYLPTNQAWVVMWHEQVLRIFNRFDDAEKYADDLAGNKSLQANAARPSWLIPALIGGALLAGLVLFAGGSKAATSATNKLCPVDKQKFEAWLIEKQLAGECAPNVTNPPYTYIDLQKAGLAPAEFSPYVLVIGDGSFWYYSNVNAPVAKSENLRNQYNTFLSTLKGHPADMFMVG